MTDLYQIFLYYWVYYWSFFEIYTSCCRLTIFGCPITSVSLEYHNTRVI